MMKIACIYHPRQHLHGGNGKFHYIEEAFRNLGHDVRHVETFPEMKVADSECEVLLFEQRQPGGIDNNDLVKFAPEKKARWIQWNFDILGYQTDLPIQQQDWWTTFGPTMQAMDVVLVKERNRLREFRGNDVPAVYFDQACPSSMKQCGHPEKPEFDIVLWGQASAWYGQRISDVKALIEAGYKVGWASAEGLSNVPGITRLTWCHADALPDLMSRAAITLHVDAFDDIDGFYSDRIWLSAGAGACTVRRITRGQRALPGYGYASTEVLLMLVKDLLADPFKRVTSGNKDRQFVMSQHTYEDRCREIVRYVDSINTDGPEKSSVPTLQGQGADYCPDAV